MQYFWKNHEISFPKHETLSLKMQNIWNFEIETTKFRLEIWNFEIENSQIGLLTLESKIYF